MTHPTRWRGRGSYTSPVLFSPYTGEPRDARDIASDPQGLLIVQPGAPLVPATPTPPVQQDDEALEALLADHQLALRLLDEVREWIRSDVAVARAGGGRRGLRLLARIDAEFSGRR